MKGRVMRITYALALLGITAGLVAGCGGTGGDGAPVTPRAAPAATSNAAPSEVSAPATAAPVPAQLDFTAKTVGGQELSGQTLAGKPVVFWFWAPWCPTCEREAPEVAKAARANPEATFVGVAALDQEPAMQEFVDKYDLGFFTNIADVDGAVWQRFGVTAQPAFAFVGANGSVDVVRGTLGESALNTRISTLLNPDG
jgi:thiol-disulfide isomerase/thioredoxin